MVSHSQPPPHGPVDGSSAEPAIVELSPVWFMGLLFEHRRTLIAVPVAIAALLAVFWVFQDPGFEARSRFITEDAQRPLSGMSSAAQMFMNISGAGASLSLYPELIGSMEILKAAAASEYTLPTEDGDTTVISLAQYYEIPRGGNPEARIKAAAGELGSNVQVQLNSGAGMVVLTTTAEDPWMAVQLNRTLLDLVHTWNIERRQSRARAEREFLEGQLSEAQSELREAEAALQRFLEKNRSYQQSPELLFQQNRLQRRVDMIQQRYVSMAQAYDQARAEEVRHTPFLNVVDAPADNVRPVNTSLALRVLFGLVAGFLIAVTIVLVREYLAYDRRRRPEEYERLHQRVASTWRPLAAQLRRSRPRSDAA